MKRVRRGRPRSEKRRKRTPLITHVRGDDPPPQQKNRGKRRNRP